MPDLLAHVFIAYSICRVLSWRWEWLTTQYVTVGMVGAFIPDLVKIKLLVPSAVVERLLGVPFDWGSLATGGGTLLSVCIGLVLLTSTERRRGGVLLGIGAGTHLLADSLLLTPTGHSVQLFWPLSQYKVPSPGLYLSTQPEPMLVTGGVAVLVWGVHRYVVDGEGSTRGA
ncbi:metal-dependent hydrolase [Halobellus ordinarius]|uniref:metal-dependent hydrolase n=1 Tax=Halobellus ordinarius TaxID=3075120 RepID=UPI002880A7C2|nr:metal-dependent hydrolase [Halobellus sp. ZY16]